MKMRRARWQLASLWLSQASRVLADQCLRLFVVLTIAKAGAAQREAAWHQVVTLFALPSVLLAPFNGAISNGLPKRGVLVWSALACLAVPLAFALWGGNWLVCFGLVAVGSALYLPTRTAMLPAAAQDAHLPLARVNGLIEMGTWLAFTTGLLVGGIFYEDLVPGIEWPVPVVVVVAASLVGVLAGVPTRFASDLWRPETPGRAVADFFRDCRRILRNVRSRDSLLALAFLRGLVVTAIGPVVSAALVQHGEQSTGHWLQFIFRTAGYSMAGAAAGSLLAGVQGHPQRALGLVPLGATGLVVALALGAICGVAGWICLLVGFMGGLMTVPLAATYQANVPADARGNAMAVLNTAGYLAIALMAPVLAELERRGLIGAAGLFWILTGLTGVAAALAWRTLLRPTVELAAELLIWPFYRVRGYGPGMERFPSEGPVLVIGNHASWFDPVWLAKLLPRELDPMMTSVFYDKPAVRWIFKIAHAIRVQASTYRREAPELQEALAALDRGQCVLIFPEGSMRRKDEKPLRLFGQGVWHLLRERPRTPVVVCWIEGGWGSYFSYKNGPPTMNKRLDVWRHIDIGVDEPRMLDAALFADQKATRAELMRLCLEARRHLGLQPLTAELATEEAGWTGEDEEERALESQ